MSKNLLELVQLKIEADRAIKNGQSLSINGEIGSYRSNYNQWITNLVLIAGATQKLVVTIDSIGGNVDEILIFEQELKKRGVRSVITFGDGQCYSAGLFALVNLATRGNLISRRSEIAFHGSGNQFAEFGQKSKALHQTGFDSYNRPLLQNISRTTGLAYKTLLEWDTHDQHLSARQSFNLGIVDAIYEPTMSLATFITLNRKRDQTGELKRIA